MAMNGSAVNDLGIISMLDGHLNACVSGFGAPSFVREVGGSLVDLTNSRIERYYKLQEAVRKKIAVASGSIEQQLAQEDYAVAVRMFRREVWKRHPKLIGKPVTLYIDWSGVPEEKPKEEKVVSIATHRPKKVGVVH